uniref:hypothetical protein n=1 Tax=uncultured Sphingomonas sp. TaxID=158754 RepID=UPI0035C9B190
MTDPVIRPDNGLFMFQIQAGGEGSPATLNPATDVALLDVDSMQYTSPYKSEAVNEATGSFAASAPMVMGQPFSFTFKARIRGAGPATVYTSTVKPPLHPLLSACGLLGQFTPAVASAALTAGTTSTATLGTGFGATAQLYRGLPLILTGAPAANRMSLITDYTAGRVATLADLFGSALSATNSAAIPAAWSYSPTTPYDSASRIAMHPCGTAGWYEDGVLHQVTDVRGSVDFDGKSSAPGFGTFTLKGIYAGPVDAALPLNAVYSAVSAPMLVQGTSGQPAFQINRRGLPISTWSVKMGATLEDVEDPNTSYGYAASQLADRSVVLECDPLRTQVAVRNVLADIGNYSQYPAGLQFGYTSGNRWSLLLPVVQPFASEPGMRDKLRSETNQYQALSAGRDSANRDGDLILSFS